MPQIIVAADRGAAFGQGTMTLREGVTVADFQSEHFATQLVERLGWAVEDADQLERAPGEMPERAAEVEQGAGIEQSAELENAIADPEPVGSAPAEDTEPAGSARAEDREPVTAR